MTCPPTNAVATASTLTPAQRALVPIAAFAASGDMDRLRPALDAGLQAGLGISDIREVLLQLYAYAGFPRSLNALGLLMQVVEERKARGIEDRPGREPLTPVPSGDALRAAGIANQTRLAGAVVSGPLFDFAPQANMFLQTHLFGAVFERDNLDWASRELATVSMLAALQGVDSQLQAHMRMSRNAGLSQHDLQEVIRVLAERVDVAAAKRAESALQATP